MCGGNINLINSPSKLRSSQNPAERQKLLSLNKRLVHRVATYLQLLQSVLSWDQLLPRRLHSPLNILSYILLLQQVAASSSLPLALLNRTPYSLENAPRMELVNFMQQNQNQIIIAGRRW
jgi:hypothetical protein